MRPPAHHLNVIHFPSWTKGAEMAAGQRTPSCSLRASGVWYLLLLKHSSAVAQAHLQTAHTQPTQTSCSTPCKSTNLYLKFIKGWCPGKAWVLVNLVGIWWDWHQTHRLWKSENAVLKSSGQLAGQHTKSLLFARDGKRTAWPQPFSQHSSESDTRSVPGHRSNTSCGIQPLS